MSHYIIELVFLKKMGEEMLKQHQNISNVFKVAVKIGVLKSIS